MSIKKLYSLLLINSLFLSATYADTNIKEPKFVKNDGDIIKNVNVTYKGHTPFRYSEINSQDTTDLLFELNEPIKWYEKGLVIFNKNDIYKLNMSKNHFNEIKKQLKKNKNYTVDFTGFCFFMDKIVSLNKCESESYFDFKIIK